jgi:hypothetical protein
LVHSPGLMGSMTYFGNSVGPKKTALQRGWQSNRYGGRKVTFAN